LISENIKRAESLVRHSTYPRARATVATVPPPVQPTA
jgi:hypothetical protein